MRIQKFLLLLLCMAPITSALAAAPVPDSASNSSISGVVSDSMTGAPIAGATVVLKRLQLSGKWDYQWDTWGQTQTDAQGRYSFTGLTPTEGWDRYSVEAAKQGYRVGTSVQLELAGGEGRSVNLKLLRLSGAIRSRTAYVSGGISVASRGSDRVLRMRGNRSFEVSFHDLAGRMSSSGTLSSGNPELRLDGVSSGYRVVRIQEGGSEISDYTPVVR